MRGHGWRGASPKGRLERRWHRRRYRTLLQSASAPMPEPHHPRARALFEPVAALPPRDRGAVLDAACRDEPGLRAEIEGLLAHDANLGTGRGGEGFLNSPLVRAAVPAESTPTQIGRYRVERLLGQGGFGLAYLAHDDRLQRLVAVKVPHAHLVARATVAET